MTSTTMPTGAAAVASGVKATWTCTVSTLVRPMNDVAERTCYRHPDRVTGIGGSIYTNGVLIAVARTGPDHLIGVAEGQYWRLITAAFLHYGPFHLLLNMLALWWFGSLLEQRIGSGRFLLLYLVSGLAGSAGALLWSPLVPTVGASGAIFGILGAGLVLERQRDYVFGGSALGIIVINFIITFSISSI